MVLAYALVQLPHSLASEEGQKLLTNLATCKVKLRTGQHASTCYLINILSAGAGCNNNCDKWLTCTSNEEPGRFWVCLDFSSGASPHVATCIKPNSANQNKLIEDAFNATSGS
jgi:hypothetical protein